MQLQLEDDTRIDQPTDEQILLALAKLSGDRISFAILSQGAMTYIQTAISQEGGYALEYQEEGIQRHYRTVTPPDFQQVVSAFQRYAKGDMSWKDEFEWEREDLSSARGGGCGTVVVAMIILLLGATMVAR